MSKSRVIVTSVVVEGRAKAAVARDYAVSRRWVHTLVSRYLTGGWEALQTQSRRPRTSPRKTSTELEEHIVALRKDLAGQGLDAGAHTIAYHLSRAGVADPIPAPSTIWKVLKRHGLIEDQPKKRPKSSYRRFQAELPNECWQADFTHWPLADGTDTEILTFLDDHSRLALAITCHKTVTVTNVLTTFRHAIDQYGPPASTLTDNGLVFTARFRKGLNAFENDLRNRGIEQKNGHPNHPQTQGKVERFQQTLKRWLTKQPGAENLEKLQRQLETFQHYYNHQRPHRSLDRRTPSQAYTARGKARPRQQSLDGHWRIRHDRVDDAGSVTLRYHSRLHHIGIGRAHAGKHVKLLIHNRHIRVINSKTGELLRHLTLDPTRNYQPQHQP